MRLPGTGPAEDRWTPSALAAVIAFAVGQAVFVANGALAPTALAWVTVAVVAALAALALPAFPRVETRLGTVLVVVLVAALAWQFSQLFLSLPAVTLRYKPGWHFPYFQRLSFAAIAAGALVAPQGRARQVFILAALAAFFVTGAWILSETNPTIDVLIFQRDSAAALARFDNPYALTFPNPYGHTKFYGPGVVENGRLMFGYPYPPLSLLLTTAAQLVAGDVRFAQLLAVTLTGGLLAFLRPGPLGPLAAAIYLFTPRTFFVLEQSWTEPLVVFGLTLVVFIAVHRPRWLGWALGFFFALKQYTVLAAPLVLLLVQPLSLATLRPLAFRAAAVVAAIWVPFFALNPRAFLHSVVTLQFNQPFRTDALSYLAWAAQPEGTPPVGAWVAFAAALLMIAAVLLRAPRTPAGFALGVTAVFLVFFALNKQAFCNYYYFVIGGACLALAAAAPREPVPATAPQSAA